MQLLAHGGGLSLGETIHADQSAERIARYFVCRVSLRKPNRLSLNLSGQQLTARGLSQVASLITAKCSDNSLLLTALVI